MKTYVNKIETLGLVDGPGIRTVIFFGGCNLRCKFCHNPETWHKEKANMSVDELTQKILRNKPYYGNNGGVTLSGGEPLLHKEFIIELCKRLKKEKIHIALDTAGINNGNNKELLKLIDLVLLDIKGTNEIQFKDITQTDKYNEFKNFIKELNKANKEVWIRQVIIPNINDNKQYIEELSKYLKKNIKNITKIEFLPFHTMGFEKYKNLKIKNPYQKKSAMDNKKCQELENYFNKIYKEQ